MKIDQSFAFRTKHRTNFGGGLQDGVARFDAALREVHPRPSGIDHIRQALADRPLLPARTTGALSANSDLTRTSSGHDLAANLRLS